MGGKQSCTMRIEFLNHEKELESIETFLERHTFPDICDLKKFLMTLERIETSLDSSILSDQFEISSYLEKQKSLVKKLVGRCHELEIRKDVINLAEDAEKLANTSPGRSSEEVTKDAHALRDRIDLFTKDHRPSRSNAKFIRFAKACVEKAERHEPVAVKSKNGRSKKTLNLDDFRLKEATPERLDLAETLYELAILLYKEQYGEFLEMFSSSFSPSEQKEILFHVSNSKGDIKNLSDQTTRLRTIQGILGFAHLSADYYMGKTPYPSIIEVHSIFEDLDFISHLEDDKS